jgi:L-rhamnose-H+ transport protein
MSVMLVGIIVCAFAGNLKARGTNQNATSQARKGSFRLGLILCILAGALSGLVNFAFIYGTEITQHARDAGADPLSAINAIWALVFISNYAVNVVYCVYLLVGNGTAGELFVRGTTGNWLRAIAMGVLWSGGIVVYGVGAYQIGKYGAYIGFPMLLSTALLTGNIVGFISGEWRGANVKASRMMFAGIGILLIAIACLANSNRLMPQ